MGIVLYVSVFACRRVHGNSAVCKCVCLQEGSWK